MKCLPNKSVSSYNFVNCGGCGYNVALGVVGAVAVVCYFSGVF